MERFTARLPNVESYALDRCGHSLHDDCPQQAHPLLSEFLERAWL
jgi:pimeloyl-ACP methyl ester carboxylesterase